MRLFRTFTALVALTVTTPAAAKLDEEDIANRMIVPQEIALDVMRLSGRLDSFMEFCGQPRGMTTTMLASIIEEHSWMNANRLRIAGMEGGLKQQGFREENCNKEDLERLYAAPIRNAIERLDELYQRTVKEMAPNVQR